MKRTPLALVGLILLAACGQQEAGNIAAANNAAEAIPVDATAPAETGNAAGPGNASASDDSAPVSRPTPDARPRPAPGADKQIMPLERRTDRVEPAPPPEPAPAPKSSCTPEHEAMGHCKQ